VFFLALNQASNEFDFDATNAALNVDTDLCTSITMMRVDVAITVKRWRADVGEETSFSFDLDVGVSRDCQPYCSNTDLYSGLHT
jgi:hypothetical protein